MRIRATKKMSCLEFSSTHCGYLTRKSTGRWSFGRTDRLYFVLSGPNLRAFTNESMQELRASVHLGGAKVFENVESSKNNSLTIVAHPRPGEKSGESQRLVAQSQEEMLEWLGMLTRAAEHPVEVAGEGNTAVASTSSSSSSSLQVPAGRTRSETVAVPPSASGVSFSPAIAATAAAPSTSPSSSSLLAPPPPGHKKRAQSVSMRAEKKVMDTFAKTKKGRAKLLEMIPDETPARKLLNAAVHFAGTDAGPEVAVDLEANILKMLVKFMVLHKYNVLDRAELTKGKPLMLTVCRMVAGGADQPFVAASLSAALSDFKRISCNVLAPHVTDKTVAKLQSLFDFLADEARITRLFTLPQNAADAEAIQAAVRSVLPELEAREDVEVADRGLTQAPSKAMRLLGLGADVSSPDKGKKDKEAAKQPQQELLPPLPEEIGLEELSSDCDDDAVDPEEPADVESRGGADGGAAEGASSGQRRFSLVEFLNDLNASKEATPSAKK